MEKMRLRDRILMGYSAPIVLFIIMSVMVYMNLRGLSESFQSLIEFEDKVVLAGDSYRGMSMMVRSLRGLVITQDKAGIATYEKGDQLFHEATSKLEKTVKDPEQRRNLGSVIEIVSRYDREIGKPVIALVKEGKYDEALTEVRKEGGSIVRELDKVMDDFNRRESELLAEETKIVESTIHTLTLTLVVSAVLVIILSMGAAYLISQKAITTVNGAVLAISTATAEMAASMEEHERTASAQAATVNQTSVTMEELNESSRQSAEQAESASNTTQKGVGLTEKGAKAIQETLNGMGRTKDKAKIISEQILRLSEFTGQIGAIATLVSDIANQVNMLSLNAAVEAARAGEHGRGFAVVAQEIRKLADQAKKSIERVNNLVNDVQKATNAVVMAAEEGTKAIDEGTDYMKNMADVLNEVSVSMRSIYENAQQVTLTARQQAAGITQVVEGMNSINAGARETAAGISQTKIGIEKLKETTAKLKEMV